MLDSTLQNLGPWAGLSLKLLRVCIIASEYTVSTNDAHLSQVVQRLYLRAHEYANLANRAGPIPTDLRLACEDQDMSAKDLHKVSRASQRQGMWAEIHNLFSRLTPPFFFFLFSFLKLNWAWI
jgi:hypothetical protein